jgi:hypothetical protein
MFLRCFVPAIFAVCAVMAHAAPEHAYAEWSARFWNTEGGGRQGLLVAVTNGSPIRPDTFEYPVEYSADSRLGGVGNSWAGFRGTVILSARIDANLANIVAIGYFYTGNDVNGQQQQWNAVGRFVANTSGFTLGITGQSGRNKNPEIGVQGQWGRQMEGNEQYGSESAGKFLTW